ncbi:mechanosensitive ion channel [Pseudoalteromonas sp. SMS1]|uniref:mechanosensitive ion channel domain-containing protein n=1 Tax=Pseudoalteromonas sp. SMS1 TaxID=2908894 RepID=UPI001F328A6F|nr:mechanosensitive ion channel domain-containing protein [Pseudoalteromonas sp. SMS1]MCF2858721.1 mechanosensitive ion channel [Pseudoalteromonas sp. SMS1]
MTELIKYFQNIYVAVYVVLLIASQFIVLAIFTLVKTRRRFVRAKAGLSAQKMLSHGNELAQHRQFTKVQAWVFICQFFGLPVVLCIVAYFVSKQSADIIDSLTISFLLMFFWLTFVGTDALKSLLSGFAFKVLTGFNKKVQVGDVMQIAECKGELISLDSFHTQIKQSNGYIVTFPTADMWHLRFASATSGSASAPCEIPFYLASFIEADKLQSFERGLWNELQNSRYVDLSEPIKINFKQNSENIEVCAVAHVALARNESVFKSELYRAMLLNCAKDRICLANSECTS